MNFIETADLNIMLDYGLDVYKHFMTEVKIGKKLLSPLRNEKNPSFSIYSNRKSGTFYWKDQGSGKFGDHWDFIKEKTGLTFKESIDYVKQNILYLGNYGVDNQRVNEAALRVAQTVREKPIQHKSKIIPTYREWNDFDRNYFQSTINMTVEDMERAWYYPAKSVRVIKEGKDYTLYEKPDSPIYMIRFPSGNYKIYRPFEMAKRKWLSNVDKDTDFYLLPECKGGDVVLIQSGNRDCAALRKHLRIDSFALNSETANLPIEVFLQLKALYNKIFVLYDNDKAGYIGAEKQYKEYGIPSLNHIYKQLGVNDFCQVLEEKKELIEKLTLFIYSEL